MFFDKWFSMICFTCHLVEVDVQGYTSRKRCSPVCANQIIVSTSERDKPPNLSDFAQKFISCGISVVFITMKFRLGGPPLSVHRVASEVAEVAKEV